MCKALNEGGKRCSFHIVQGVCTAVVAYATSLTGLSRKETDEAFAALKEEGRNAPAPSREEVDGFLVTQAFRVRTEPTLTEAKRGSILNRLQSAIGKATPDGATFHAWKNVVAEAWARSRKRAAGVFLISGLAFGMGGCATGPTNAAPQPSTSGPVATAPASPTAGATVAPVGSTPAATGMMAAPPFVAKATYSKDVVAKYGQASAEAAHDLTSELTTTEGFSEARMRQTPGEISQDDFASIKPYLTPSAAKDLDANAAKWVSDPTDATANANLMAVAMYGLNNDKYRLREDVPALSGVRVERAQVDLDTDGKRVIVTQHVTTTARFEGAAKGDLLKMGLTRDTTYVLVKGTSKDRPWLIDGWSTNQKAADPVADVR